MVYLWDCQKDRLYDPVDISMDYSYPKMTAFHSMMLLSVGAPLTPAGGSSWSLQLFIDTNKHLHDSNFDAKH